MQEIELMGTRGFKGACRPEVVSYSKTLRNSYCFCRVFSAELWVGTALPGLASAKASQSRRGFSQWLTFVWKAGDRTEVGNPGLDIHVAPAFGLARKLEIVRNTWTLTSFGPSDVGVHGNLGIRQNTRSQRAQRAAGVTPLPHSLVSHVFHTCFRTVSYLSRTPGFYPWFQSCCTSRCIPVES